MDLFEVGHVAVAQQPKQRVGVRLGWPRTAGGSLTSRPFLLFFVTPLLLDGSR
jgi:hypothetical protein